MSMSTNLPDPAAHPGVFGEEPPTLTTVRSLVSQRRLGLGLFIIGWCWVFANSMAAGTLFAAKLAIVSPDHKVFWLGVATAAAGAVSSVLLFIFGAVSDLTRSRFGRRSPWVVFGGVFGGVGLVLIALAGSIPTLIAAFLAYCVVAAALPAAMLAVFPDRVPKERLGTASAVYGGAQVLGGSMANIITSQFLSNPTPLFYIAAVILVGGSLAFVIVAPDHSSKGAPRAALDLKGLADAFRFPKGAPDFYWAFAGRFLLLLGLYMVMNFGLYILTDHMHLTNDEAGTVIAIGGLASLVTIVTSTLVAGPLSDRIGRRKLPIFVSSMLFGIAVFIPLVWPTGTAWIIFGAVSGFGLGAFLSVDAALMTEVLPNEETRGKDLGILNTANTVPGILAPLVTSSIVGAGFGYNPVFIVSIVIILVGAFSIFMIKSVR